MIRAVVFDVGETLVDETRAFTELARAAGLTPLTLAAALGAVISRGEDHRRIWELLGVPRPDHELDIRREDLYPDALPALRELRAAGLRLGIAGNQPAGAERDITALDLPVDFVAGSGSWGVTKPDPAFFAQVTDGAGVPAHEIVYVGDRVDNDVVPARAAGMTAVLIRRGPWGHLAADDPRVAQAHAAVDSLHDLVDVVRALDGDR